METNRESGSVVWHLHIFVWKEQQKLCMCRVTKGLIRRSQFTRASKQLSWRKLQVSVHPNRRRGIWFHTWKDQQKMTRKMLVYTWKSFLPFPSSHSCPVSKFLFLSILSFLSHSMLLISAGKKVAGGKRSFPWIIYHPIPLEYNGSKVRVKNENVAFLWTRKWERGKKEGSDDRF